MCLNNWHLIGKSNWISHLPTDLNSNYFYHMNFINININLPQRSLHNSILFNYKGIMVLSCSEAKLLELK